MADVKQELPMLPVGYLRIWDVDDPDIDIRAQLHHLLALLSLLEPEQKRAATAALGMDGYREMASRAANAENARDAMQYERDAAIKRAEHSNECFNEACANIDILRAENEKLRAELAPPKNQCTCWYHPAAPKPRNADCPEHGVNRPGQGKHAQHEAVVMANEALLKERIRKLSDEVEQLCVQLAGCSTAAAGYGNKPEPLSRDAYGWSVAFDDVCKLYEKKERARLALEPLRAKCARQRRELRRLNQKQRNMLADVADLAREAVDRDARIVSLESELATLRAKESPEAAWARGVAAAYDALSKHYAGRGHHSTCWAAIDSTRPYQPLKEP